MSSLQPNLWVADRRITRIRLWWDDYFAILCYATAVAWAVMLPIWMRHGFGLHSEDVQGMTVEEANYTTKKYLFIIEHLYAFTLFFAKISILSFYWRMFRVANIQFAISILLTCSILWIIVRIQKLQLPILQKIAIIFLFLFGILVCVAGLAIVTVSTHFNNKSQDMTYQLAPVIIWASVEVNLVTISTCLPIIRPAFLYMMTCTDPTTTFDSGSSAYRRNYPRSQTRHSIHLSKIPNAESSSTHVLTQLVNESIASIEDLDRRAHHGHTASVTLSSRPVTPGPAGVGGIMVKNETFVHKESIAL
ncbi:hypothetical protein FGSG_03377 [Fusarium graminearum PH-1]|uniref:hypothetical protein n=1 Tax=Gibberella zeae (strain ATCC MYA-4620 / CBS 123657 / FGSC 9075 / NRRL 31084 / PH-1) TaxID=229533 RepID=UPI000023EC73|nr:hypothetical protein FGSG_03377 [Fusarium graminearum PH-1]ESU09851.1 hypothetical protein FGSG_03377 [Fusarium graminearum PH-1]|eukprot:XP_011322350.1 hypothetical protein FGSG_03377 [Fusarium graminearum PH-1]